MFLLARNDFQMPDKKALGRQYILEVGKFNSNVVPRLIEKGFVENFNSPGEFFPDMLVLCGPAHERFIDATRASEIWSSYPATFTLNGKGSRFLARAGGDKDELIYLYLTKINHSATKHEFVMTQLKKYVELVERGEINGHKIGDWIRGEMWDTVAAIEQKGGDFGTDA